MTTRDGLGGFKTIRGVLRNRIAGQDYLYGNLELRWKFLRTIVMNQNLYIALAGFYDFGKVTRNFSFDKKPEAQSYLDQGSKETWHGGYGAGLYFAMNQNFVVNFSYGLATNSQDGKNGIYIGLNFLY